MKTILVNFGGPRCTEEIEPFLIALLTDRDVVRSSWPQAIHKLFFTWIAKKRAKVIVHDYELIGGKSPIFEDTEALAALLRTKINEEVLTFHRYLPMTHPQFIDEIKALDSSDPIQVFPLFPQFSYTTTGSIARWFGKHLPPKLIGKLHWIKSYPDHSAFTNSFCSIIQACLKKHQMLEEETLLLFSAHGLPKSYVTSGDPYQGECERSFRKIAAAFPKAAHQLCYQSLFGKKEWVRPYTLDCCYSANPSYRNIVVVPLSFTSDHIETLFEIEQRYLPILKNKGIHAVRCPALNLTEEWVDGIVEILLSEETVSYSTLINPLAN